MSNTFPNNCNHTDDGDDIHTPEFCSLPVCRECDIYRKGYDRGKPDGADELRRQALAVDHADDCSCGGCLLRLDVFLIGPKTLGDHFDAALGHLLEVANFDESLDTLIDHLWESEEYVRISERIKEMITESS